MQVSGALVGLGRPVAIVDRLQVFEPHPGQRMIAEHADSGVPHVGALQVRRMVRVEHAVEPRPVRSRGEHVDGDSRRQQDCDPARPSERQHRRQRRQHSQPRAARVRGGERHAAQPGDGRGGESPSPAAGEGDSQRDRAHEPDLARKRHVVANRPPGAGGEARAMGDEAGEPITPRDRCGSEQQPQRSAGPAGVRRMPGPQRRQSR